MTAVSKPRVHRSLGSALLILGLLVACTGNEAAPERLCTPGAYVYCRCQNRDPGTKLCKKSGQEFEECLPCDGSGNTGTGSGGADAFGSEGRLESSENEESSQTREETLDAGPESDAGGGDTTPNPKPERDGGKPPTTTPQPEPGPDVDAPHCKAIANSAPKVEVQKIADVPAAAKGGKVKDGVYLQSWVVEFTGPDGESGPSKHYSKETIEIRGKYGRYAFEDDDGKVRSGGLRISVAENEKKVNVEYECPAAKPRDLSYDATDTTIVVYDPPYARVFVRQKEAQ